jgi:hypothetical protein
MTTTITPTTTGRQFANGATTLITPTLALRTATTARNGLRAGYSSAQAHGTAGAGVITATTADATGTVTGAIIAVDIVGAMATTDIVAATVTTDIVAATVTTDIVAAATATMGSVAAMEIMEIEAMMPVVLTVAAPAEVAHPLWAATGAIMATARLAPLAADTLASVVAVA